MFYLLREREIWFSLSLPTAVIPLIQPEKARIAHITKVSQPTHVCSDGIKQVAMSNQITASATGCKCILLHQLDIGKLEWNETVEKIIMIAHHIDNLSARFSIIFISTLKKSVCFCFQRLPDLRSCQPSIISPLRINLSQSTCCRKRVTSSVRECSDPRCISERTIVG